MPLKQIKPESFLDEDEIKFLADQRDWPVSVISPRLEDVDLTFRQWNMPKDNGDVSPMYLFKTRWTEVYKKTQLQRGDVIKFGHSGMWETTFTLLLFWLRRPKRVVRVVMVMSVAKEHKQIKEIGMMGF
ncbi:hypothetical protein M0R45_038268 [Rubus argutus]|uniref:TF-B3 domain-containing protein n=1 Tax=Rubus argutus TaxID=59490 RepID=A0AAW1W4T5_RUBAR